MNSELQEGTIKKIAVSVSDQSKFSKESITAITQAATAFALYLASASNEFTKERKAERINSADVLAALEEINFDEFVEPIKRHLEAYSKSNEK